MHAVRCTSRHRNREDHILPRNNRLDEKTQLDVEKSKPKIEKNTHIQEARERKKFKSGKEAIKSKKSRKYTQENAQIFADFRLARLARGLKQRQKQ